MKKRYLLDPRVDDMIKLVVSRKIGMFRAYPDIDAESLFTDIKGELRRSRYDPTKRAPHSHAHQVASCRIIDILRRRTKEAEKQAEARKRGEYLVGHTDPDMTPEEIAANLYEAARGILAQAAVPDRHPKANKTHGLTMTQQTALHLLQQRMGWSCRQAEREVRARPEVMHIVGISAAPDHTFFSRAARTVARIRNLFLSDSSDN